MSALYRQNVSIEHEEETTVLEYAESEFVKALEEASKLRAEGRKVALKLRKG